MITPKTRIIITLAGRGSRFIEKGYKVPKYLLPIKINSKKDKIINHILKGIFDVLGHQIDIVIVLNIQDYFQVKDYFINLSLENRNIQIKYIPLLNGQSYSTLAAFDFSEPDHSFTVFNGDTLVELKSIKPYINRNQNIVSTFLSESKDYSYVVLDKKGFIRKIVEKKVISKFATTGVYSFRSRNLFTEALANLEKSRIYNTKEIYISEVIQKLLNNSEDFVSVQTNMTDFGNPHKYELNKNA